MAKMHNPVDHMFRAGQISSKEWKRLSMTANGKGGKTHGRMANFEEKTKNEGAGKLRGVAATTSRSINTNQTMGTAATAGGKPPFGGMHSKGPTPGRDAINQKQKPLFPKGGGKKGSAVSSGSTQPLGGEYGGPSSRPSAPARLGR